MLWDRYVFRRGDAVQAMWGDLLRDRDVAVLFITGEGFDVRAQKTLGAFLKELTHVRPRVRKAQLLLMGFPKYELDPALKSQTKGNIEALKKMFAPFGSAESGTLGPLPGEDEEATANHLLRTGLARVLKAIDGFTDIVLDISSLPRVAYLTLITGILEKLVSTGDTPLAAGGVNFQVLVGEDSRLDSRIKPEDPSTDLIMIPGYSSALNLESTRDWPLVWFPLLGESRTTQLEKVIGEHDPAEVCPVVPHPSKDPRRADQLILEYRESLFEKFRVPVSNVLYGHEGHPFEVYRQLVGAMDRYRRSLSILGGCRLVVTPLSSKLMTVGAGLACFELKRASASENCSVAIPYAEPRRYSVSVSELNDSNPDVACLLLTGQAYS